MGTLERSKIALYDIEAMWRDRKPYMDWSGFKRLCVNRNFSFDKRGSKLD